MTFLVVFICFALQLHSSYASPLMRRDLANCVAPHAAIDSTCWSILELSAYVQSWTTATPTCEPDADTSACCSLGEAWTTCFLRMNQPESGTDCTQIGSCAFSPSLAQLPAGNVSAKAHYVIYNIYALNQFFTSWYYATNFATTQAALAITGIIDDVDPDKKANGLLNDLLTAFGLGLAFVGIPEVEAIEPAVKTIASIVLTAAQQAPGVVKALWPTGTGTQTWQMSSLSNSLGSLSTQFQGNINNALQSVQSDVPSFIAFAGGGVFSSPSPPSLPNETYGLDAAFKTYLVSTALTGNNHQFVMYIDAVKPSTCTYDTNTGLCTSFVSSDGSDWYSTNSNAQYNLDPDPNMLPDIINNNYTTGRQLFDGAATCNGMWDTAKEAWQANMTQNTAYPSPKDTGVFSISAAGLDFSCLSQATVYLNAIGDVSGSWSV